MPQLPALIVGFDRRTLPTGGGGTADSAIRGLAVSRWLFAHTNWRVAGGYPTIGAAIARPAGLEHAAPYVQALLDESRGWSPILQDMWTHGWHRDLRGCTESRKPLPLRPTRCGQRTPARGRGAAACRGPLDIWGVLAKPKAVEDVAPSEPPVISAEALIQGIDVGDVEKARVRVFVLLRAVSRATQVAVVAALREFLRSSSLDDDNAKTLAAGLILEIINQFDPTLVALTWWRNSRVPKISPRARSRRPCFGIERRSRPQTCPLGF